MPRELPPDEFWVCCQIVPHHIGKRIIRISCGTAVEMGHTVCTECNHQRCESCQLWSRQVQGGKGCGGGGGKEGRESSESASEGEENVRGGGDSGEEEGVSCR